MIIIDTTKQVAAWIAMCCCLLQVVIVGPGAFGQGLASLASRSGATASYAISLGTRKMGAGQSGTLPGLEATPVAALSDTLPYTDMVRQEQPVLAVVGIIGTALCASCRPQHTIDVLTRGSSNEQACSSNNQHSEINFAVAAAAAGDPGPAFQCSAQLCCSTRPPDGGKGR